jgi:4-amino-4-deoxy-L-arabinose transferase-like glycosyltransferase
LKAAFVRLAPALGLGAIIALGAFLRFYQLGAYSIGNTYYAATVKSMLASWHNFFYAAFEPGGSVTVDKPPLGFWVQALSAYFLGVNGFALALPQALAGVFSLPLLYHLVRRHFGVGAGLAAALVLALAPVTVATERNNTIDGLLVFVLLLAAWAFIVAAETGRLRWLLLGALLVGLGFNIKMLQAVMPLPAFYLVYLLGARHAWWRRLLHLGLATLVFLVVALAWVAAVDLTPASQRPYIGSSTNNTVLELIIGHNGLSRLGLNDRGPGGDGGRPLADGPQADLQGPGALAPGAGSLPRAQRRQLPVLPGDATPGDALPARPSPMQSENGFPNPPIQPGSPGGVGRPDGPGNGRQNETGAPGPLRLFEEPLVTEASWLLPLALLGIPLAGVALGWAWPLAERHLGLLLWAGWLLPGAAYFSFTGGLFHRYYLIMLGPPLAALVGISLWALWVFWQRRHAWGWTVLLVLSGFTLAFELFTLRSYPDYAGPVAALSLLAWLAGILWLARRSLGNWGRVLGLSLVALALLAAPFSWSLLTALDTQPNVALPTAGPGEADQTRATFMTPDQDALGPVGQAVLEYALAHTDPEAYLLATHNARDAAPYILATGRAVLTFGGFTGSDAVVDLDDFIEMLSSGELRFVLGLPENKPQISRYLREHCSVVELPALSPGSRRAGDQLYDCGT